jgi:hypothetical protein
VFRKIPAADNRDEGEAELSAVGMHWIRWLASVLAVAAVVGALVGAGVLAHREALVLTLEPGTPGTGGAAGAAGRPSVVVRNRLAAFVPVRGSGFSPAWALERQTSGRWEPVQTMESENEATWLFPYQRNRFDVSVEAPGTYRAVAASGLRGEASHASRPLALTPIVPQPMASGTIVPTGAAAPVEDVPRLTH